MTSPYSGGQTTYGSPGSQGGAQSPLDASILEPETSGSSGGSMYGLGSVKDMTVDLDGNQVKAEDAIQRVLQQSSPSQIAQIQSYLWKGGFYSDNADAPNLGVWGPDDIKALGDVVSTSAQTNVPVMDFLRRSAAYGVYTGIAGAVSGHNGSVSQSARLEIRQADPKALAQNIDRAFKELTGRRASKEEKAGFVAAFNAAYKAAQTANFEAQYGSIDPLDPGAAPMPPEYLPTAPPGAPDIPHGRFGFGAVREGIQRAQSYAANAAFTEANGGGSFGNLVGLAYQNVLNSEENARRYQADQQFLQLADQPMWDQGGGSFGSGSGSGTFTTQDFDPQAYAESYVRDHATGEVGGHDAATTFNMFLNILRGQ